MLMRCFRMDAERQELCTGAFFSVHKVWEFKAGSSWSIKYHSYVGRILVSTETCGGGGVSHSYTKMNFAHLLMSVSEGVWWKCDNNNNRYASSQGLSIGIEMKSSTRTATPQTTSRLPQQGEKPHIALVLSFSSLKTSGGRLRCDFLLKLSWFWLPAKCRAPNIFSRWRPESQNCV